MGRNLAPDRVESEEIKMKNKMMRLLSMMLALVLAVGLVQGVTVEAEAAETMTFQYAYDCQRDPAFPTKGQSVSINGFDYPLTAEATYENRTRFDSNEGPWSVTLLGKYSEISNRTGYLPSVVDNVAEKYNMNADDVKIYQLKRNGVDVVRGVVIAESATDALFLGENFNSMGAGYLLSDRLTDSQFNFTIEEDVTEDVTPTNHTHTWKIDTAGNGTKEAKAAIRCTAAGCDLNGKHMEVKLTTSDVTLPGNVFPITVSVDYGMGRSNDFTAFTVSEEPGFKYSPDGTDYVDIYPATFVPKQGYYQASIMIKENGDSVENLYVKYTVSDPVVTAATGDERPIELMLAGMVTFGAMAAVAFVMDSKRRMSR